MTMNNTVAGIALGGVTGMALVLGDAIISHNLNLKDAITVCVFVSGLVWWMGRKFQKIEDSAEELKERLSDLPCAYCDPKKKK